MIRRASPFLPNACAAAVLGAVLMLAGCDNRSATEPAVTPAPAPVAPAAPAAPVEPAPAPMAPAPSAAATDPAAPAPTPSTGERLDSALERAGDATANAANKAANLAERAGEQTRDYLNSPEAKRDAAAVKDTLKDAGNAITSTVSDATITGSISAALARDAELSAAKIDVDTEGGVVRLTGPAPSLEAKARAESIAKGVSGVTSVNNQLTVAATR